MLRGSAAEADTACRAGLLPTAHVGVFSSPCLGLGFSLTRTVSVLFLLSVARRVYALFSFCFCEVFSFVLKAAS